MLLGRQKRAVVRPPLTKIGDAEIARIRQALVDVGPVAPESQRRVGALASERCDASTGTCLRNARARRNRHLNVFPNFPNSFRERPPRRPHTCLVNASWLSFV